MFQDRLMQREILGLMVSCPFLDEGCIWTGDVQHLEVPGNFCPFSKAIPEFSVHRTNFLKLGYFCFCLKFWRGGGGGGVVSEITFQGSQVANYFLNWSLFTYQEIFYMKRWQLRFLIHNHNILHFK